MTVKRITIEFVHGSWWLCQRGVYDRSSVLAGQDFRQLQKHYETLEQAQVENPKAEVTDEGIAPVYIPVNPPEWFDPAAAGEAWGEDDY